MFSKIVCQKLPVRGTERKEDEVRRREGVVKRLA